MSWDKIDRCGAGRLSTGPDDPFIHECTLHDHGYLKGGSVDDMMKVDREFFGGIWSKAAQDWWLIPRAFAYTAIVSIAARWWWQKESRE